MLILCCIRHASTDWNDQGRMQGRRDVPLGSTGRAEVAQWRLPESFGGPVEWISSPLSRAVETAARLCGRSPRLEPALIEMDWGDWEGYRLAELRARFGTGFTRNEQRGLDFRPPRGESPRDVMARVTRWLDAIADRDRPIVAVTHNGVLRALLAAAIGWDMTGKPPIKLQPGTLHRFVRQPGQRLRLSEPNVSLVRTLSVERRDPPLPPPPGPSAVPP